MFIYMIFLNKSFQENANEYSPSLTIYKIKEFKLGKTSISHDVRIF